MEPRLTIDDIKEFTMERFSEVRTKAELVHFHSVNKYLLLAFSQTQLNKLGKIVANHKKLAIETVLLDYKIVLNDTLQKNPTRATHANSLRRMSGHFKKSLPKYACSIIEHRISQYQKEKISISDVLSNIRALTDDIDNAYVARQTYFLLYSQ